MLQWFRSLRDIRPIELLMVLWTIAAMPASFFFPNSPIVMATMVVSLLLCLVGGMYWESRSRRTSS